MFYLNHIKKTTENVFGRRKEKRRKKNNGFTLVETLVAIFILVMATVLPISASYVGVSQAFQARDQLIASYLAQDALEHVRRTIATVIMNGGPLLGGMNACNMNPCSVDSLTDSISGGGTGRILKQDPVTHVYGYTNSWDETSFVREVWVQDNVGTTEIQITVRMEWGRVGDRKELFLKKNIRTWLEFF